MKMLRVVLAAVLVIVPLTQASLAQLRMVYPNGGEALKEGTVVPIVWTGVSQFEIVFIEFQMHQAAPWETINAAASGLHYDWTVPTGITSDECAIRIRSKRTVRSDGTKVHIMAPGHGKASYTAMFTHDGSHVFSVGEVPTVKLWNSWTGELIREFEGAFTDPVLAISPNDRFLAYSGNARVRLADLITGDTSSVAVGAQIRSLEFDRTSGRVVAGLESLHAIVIDVASTSITADFAHPNLIHAAEFSPDGRFVLTACADNSARVWSIEGDSVLHALPGHTNDNHSARYSPDGNRIVTTGFDDVVRIWDAITGLKIDSLVHPDKVKYAEYSPNGSQIVTACFDNKAHVWSATTHTEQFKLSPHSYYVSKARFSPDGKYIFTHNTFMDVLVWDATNGALKHALQGHLNNVTSAAFSNDGRIVTTCLDAGVRVFDIEQQQLVYMCLGHAVVGGGYQGRSLRASFDASESNVLCASEDGTIRSWNAETGTHTFSTTPVPYVFEYVDVHKASGIFVGTNTFGTYLFSDNGSIIGEFKTDAVQRTLKKSLISPNGALIAVLPDKTYQDTTINVLNGIDASERYSFSRLDEEFIDLLFSPDNTWLVTLADSGHIRVLNAATGDQSYHVVRPFRSITHAAFSPNGKWLAFHGESEYVWLIDTQTWTLVDSLTATVNMKKLAWSPDSKLIATVAIDRVDFLNVDQRLIIGHTFIESHNSNETDVQFSSDGKLLATMCNNVDVFETETWTLQHHLEGRSSMRHIQWDTEGKRILVVSLHHQPWVWELTPDSNMMDETDGTFRIWEEQTSVNEEQNTIMKIYPNPANDVLNIELGSYNAQRQLTIINSIGEVVVREELVSQQIRITTSQLPTGVYFISVGERTASFVKN